MLRLISVTTAAALLAACASSDTELSVTNRSSRPVEVALGERTVTVAPGKSATLPSDARRGERLKVSFVENGKGYVFRKPADHGGDTEILWLGSGRLALKV